MVSAEESEARAEKEANSNRGETKSRTAPLRFAHFKGCGTRHPEATAERFKI
jgi:hypothetical protein